MINPVSSSAGGVAQQLAQANPQPMGGRRNTFQALVALGRAPDAQDPQVARQVATQMLGELFFGPMLAEMRKFPIGKELAHGGQMEDAFAQQLDQRLADQIAGSARGLADQLLQQLHKLTPQHAASTAGEDAGAETQTRGAA